MEEDVLVAEDGLETDMNHTGTRQYFTGLE